MEQGVFVLLSPCGQFQVMEIDISALKSLALSHRVTHRRSHTVCAFYSECFIKKPGVARCVWGNYPFGRCVDTYFFSFFCNRCLSIYLSLLPLLSENRAKLGKVCPVTF